MYKASELKKAEEYLIKADPVLGRLIELQKPVLHQPRTDYFFSLCRSIVGQQISVKAAAKIFSRLEQYTELKPSVIAVMNDDLAKKIGLSKQKTTYLRDLAAHFDKDPKIYNHLEKSTDDEVIKELTDIKGVGVWTAKMFLMFTLLRLDVFAADDIGLQRAMKQLYGWKIMPSKEKMEKIADKWRPYRTIASWHLWESLNNSPLV